MTHGFPEDEKKEKDKTGPNEEAKLLTELERELPAEMKVEDILKMGNIRELVKSPEAQTYIQQYGISDATIKKLIRLQELRSKSEAETIETKKAKSIKEELTNFGALIDWAYEDYNVYSLSPSVWSVPEEYQIKADSITAQIQDKLSWLNFIEKEQNGKGFRAWQKYKHTQLGEMEIGGWCSFYKKNPPLGKRLEEVCKQNALFSLDVVELTPQIKIKETEIKPIQIVKGVTEAKASVAEDGTIQISRGDKKIADSAILIEIKIKVENVGGYWNQDSFGQKDALRSTATSFGARLCRSQR